MRERLRRQSRCQGSAAHPHRLRAQRLRGPLDDAILSAQEEIDRLYKVVRTAGYVVLFCDTTGVAVAHRGEEREADQFKYWGTWLGGVWSEAIEGTNGIGTSISEEQPVTVHRGQHFRSRHINLSCSGAPVFDFAGNLLAVLDVSAIDPELSEAAHALTGALTETAARDIEERLFREHFRREWVIAIALPDGHDPAMLLAVDGDRRIVGANRAARIYLPLDNLALRTGVSLWSAFERDDALFRHRDNNDFLARLVVAGSNEICRGLITPPQSAFRSWQSRATIALHTQPRLDLLSLSTRAPPAPQARGGLSPGALHRVSDYIDSHLSENIGLANLAAISGLSMFHFAREFKQSMGVTPHDYLVQKRVEKAQEMLVHSELPVSAIALAVGFSDQSHLARQFRQRLGITPGEFRRSRR